MTIHEFDFSSFNTGQQVRQSFVPKPIAQTVVSQEAIITSSGDPGARVNDPRDSKDCLPCDGFAEDTIDINFVEEVRETYPAGFKLMDRGIKNYYSGIRIPRGKGNEGYTILPVRISGADQDTLIYADQHIVGGRLEVPYLSITRTGETYDPKRYSPPILPITRHFKNKGKKSELVYRPTPFLIDYTLDLIAEHKHEAEHALFSIIARLNPIGSYFLEESSMGLAHEIIIHPVSSTDNSDLEMDDNSRAYVKKTINIRMEGWLPTPTKIVPNILAKPFFIKEGIETVSGIKIPGETYSVIRDTSIKQNTGD